MNATELAKIRGAEEAKITDIRKQKLENFPNHVHSPDVDNSREILNTSKQWNDFTAINTTIIDDFMQMEVTNENNKEEIAVHKKAFVALENEVRWFEVQKECNWM